MNYTYTHDGAGNPLPPRNWTDPQLRRYTWSEAIERGLVQHLDSESAHYPPTRQGGV